MGDIGYTHTHDTLYDTVVYGDDELRTIIKRHHGPVVTIGDMVTHRYHIETGKYPDISVVDGRCRELGIAEEMKQLIRDVPPVYCYTEILSPQINEEMYKAFFINHKGIIRVIGEEDHAVHLAKLYAADGTLILWGNYDCNCILCAIGGPETRAEGFDGLRNMQRIRGKEE